MRHSIASERSPARVVALATTSALILSLIGARVGLADEAGLAGEVGGGEGVIVVDLRAGDPTDMARAAQREQLAAALAAAGGIAPRQDPGLVTALAGVPGSDREARMEAARAALARARTAHGDLDCETTSRAARAAVDELAALQAAGGSVTDALRRAHAYLLLCAHDVGNVGGAMEAVSRLHRLAEAGADVAPPPGVSERVWDAYPLLDATASAQIVEVVIATEPADAVVWVDHRPVVVQPPVAGQAGGPVRVLLQEGEHIVAVAAGDASVSQRIQVVGGAREHMMRLVIPAVVPRWPDVAARVARWREGRVPVEGASLGMLMAGLDVRFALVLSSNDDQHGQADMRADIWALEPGARRAVYVGAGDLDRPADIASQVVATAGRWSRGGATRGAMRGATRGDRTPDPAVPLLRESHVPHRGAATTADGRTKKWWVYVTVIGAVAAGGLVILAHDLADDRQRIELRWP